MRTKTNDGLELYFDVCGKGIPCVYLHGGPGYWSKSFQCYAGDLLESHLQMVYFDQRGCGRSDHSSSQDYSLTRLINDMEELRKAQGIEEWIVMGHSFGGILAVNYAHRYPERTKGIILLNATLNMSKSLGHQLEKGSQKLGLKSQKRSYENKNAFIESYYSILIKLLEKEEYYKFQFMDIANKQKLDVVDYEDLNSDPKFQQFVFDSEEYFQDFISLTNSIHKPVLVIAGKHDHAVGPNHHELFNFPYCEVKVLNSSHHPYIESQLEFKEAVLNYIDILSDSQYIYRFT